MGLKVKLLPLLFKVPSCTQQPGTSSFRLTAPDDMLRAVNSVCFEPETDSAETPHSWFTNASEWDTVSTTEYDDSLSTSICGDSHLESIVREAQQSSSIDHRIFFDPTEEDSPVLRLTEELQGGSDVRKFIMSDTDHDRTPFQESVAVSMESEDPYRDFKRSMEEMVESLGVGDDWEELGELLTRYLQVNLRKNHGYVISAFVDLLAEILGSHHPAAEATKMDHNTDENGISCSTSYFSSLLNGIE